MTRFCKTCKVDHPYIDFKCNDKGIPNNHHCKKTINQRRTRKGDLQRDYNMRQKYGFGLDAFNSMFESQNGLCKICNKEKARVIDHDHVTNKVRGLLCSGCNVGIGHLKENIETLEAAIQYLKNSK